MVTNPHTPPVREEIALAEVGHTDVSRGTVRFLLGFFLLAIAAVPAFELTVAGTGADGGPPPWSYLTQMPADISAQAAALGPEAGAWKRSLAGNRAVVQGLVAFEAALEDESHLGRLLRPPTQLVMSRWLGAGNEQAYVGRDGWLFYRPDVEFVTGSGFLDEAARARRVAGADTWLPAPEPDPRPAIVRFKQQLESQGISLVVMPTPVKPSIHPERLARRAVAARLPLQNPSYQQFISDLRAAGVLVFEPDAVMVENLRATSAAQYLATDTHWRPEAMEAVAERLAEFLRLHVRLPSVEASYRTTAAEIQRLGDIAGMLDLPARQSLFPPEIVAIRRVVAPDGAPWRPSREADILLLGDSFSNIYSLASLGWGDSAGLVEHLSLALQRPVDRIVQNDDGAYATREMLHRAPDRLIGKRVVVYQFAARELSFGDWKVFE